MKKKLLISYIIVALLLIAYSITKTDNITYKYTYMNPSQNTMGKSNKCRASNFYYYCEVNGQEIMVEEYWY